jgi:hypothetical protein
MNTWSSRSRRRRLDAQRRGAHALLDEGDALLAKGVQERPTSTQDTRDR